MIQFCGLALAIVRAMRFLFQFTKMFAAARPMEACPDCGTNMTVIATKTRVYVGTERRTLACPNGHRVVREVDPASRKARTR